MSACYSWLAVTGLPGDEALQLLQLQATGEVTTGEIAEFSAARLNDETSLFISRRFDFADQTPLAELSAQGQITTCCVNENMMYSSVSLWRQGQRQWYFVHDGEFGIQHVHSEGSAPPEFHTIANRLMVVQAEGEGIAISVDHVYEVAPEVAGALTGFRLDAETSRQMQFQKLATLDESS